MDTTTATGIAALVRSGKASAEQVMRDYLDRTARLEPLLNTYAHLDSDGAMRQAQAVDRRIAAGQDPGVMAGVPVSVKDLIAVGGLPLTFGSRLFTDNIASEDAPAVARLREAGACITGKTTTSELGSKGVGDSPLTGVTRNPWNPAHTPGGSSAGAAAGVAAGLVPVALGTDGGGSIRIPASFCGLVGFKGSFGRVPVWPPSATPSLAHVGPLATNVADVALLLNVLAGPDVRDPSSLQLGGWSPYSLESAAPTGLRLGWCDDFGYGWADSQVRAAGRQAASRLASALGTRLVSWEGLRMDPAPAWSSLFYTSIARRLGMLEIADPQREALLDPVLMRKVVAARAALSDDADAALASGCRAEIAQAFERFDLLLMPTTPVSALGVGQDAPPRRQAAGAVEWSYFTYPFNLSGHPAASYPAGVSSDGLPLGLQLVARHGQEHVLLAALACLQREMAPAVAAVAQRSS
ncbi:MAG: amidase [Ramlibacter sp.]